MRGSASRAQAAGEPQRLGLWLLLALSPFALAPGLHPDLVQTSAGFVPAWNVAAPAALAHVATEPDFWRGMGMGALLPAQPLLLLGVAPARAVQWVMLVALLLGALGIYVWLHPRLGDRAAGVAGLVYLFLPIPLAAVYLWGSLNAALLLALIPLALAGLSAYATQRSLLGASVAAICLIWAVHVQAGLAVVALLLLVLQALIVERSRLAALIVAASGAAALAVPLLTGGPHAQAEPAASYATLYGLLRAGPAESEPVQVGIAAFALVVMALWALAVQRNADPLLRRLIGFSAAAATLLVALALPWSGWLWQGLGLARLAAPPWQVAILAAPFLAAAAGGAVALLPELQRPAYLGALALVVVLASAPYRTPAYTTIAPPEAPVAILGQNQVALLDATVRESAGREQAELTLVWQALRPLDFDANLFFQAVSGNQVAGAEPQVIAQLDAQPLADRPATTWRAGELATMTYALALDPAYTGPLIYYVGLYDWRDGRRLAVDGGLDDKLILQATEGAPDGDARD